MENVNLTEDALDQAVAAVEAYELKDLLINVGRQQAFALVANRTAAAQAELLRKIKNQKQYKELGLTWDEFCDQYTGMTRPTVDAMIKRLDEFGENYYRLAEVMRVSPDVYRQIEGSIDEQGMIVYGGDRVEITRQNAEVIRQIVDAGRAELRKAKQAEADAKQRAKEMTAARDAERERADQLDKAERKRRADEASLTAGLSPLQVRLLEAHSLIGRAMVKVQGVANSPDITQGEYDALRGFRDWVVDQVAAASGIPLDPITAEIINPIDISLRREPDGGGL